MMVKIPPGMPEPMDVHFGYRLRLGRTMLGISQETLGKAIGMSYQQIQKYECAATRMSASKIFELGLVLGLPISFFFDEMPDDLSVPEKGMAEVSGKASQHPSEKPQMSNPMLSREGLLLVRAYYNIADSKMRRCLFTMFQLASTQGDEEDENDTVAP